MHIIFSKAWLSKERKVYYIFLYITFFKKFPTDPYHFNLKNKDFDRVKQAKNLKRLARIRRIYYSVYAHA